MEYYQKLKSTYSKDKWSDKSEEIINKLKGKNQKGGYSEVRALAEIFIEEKYTDRLLKLLQINSKKISFIDEYADYLKKSYPKDLLTFYEEGVKRYAKSTGRDIYNEAANYLEKMKKIKGGKEKVKALIQYFREQYKNRRAMMEVLNKNFPETIPVTKGKEVQKNIDSHLKLL